MAFPTDYSALVDTVDTIHAADINNLETTLKLTTERAKFLAYNSAQDDNQTGAGGAAQVVDLDTEIMDTATAFAADVFTAPVTGLYLFTWGLGLRGLAAGHTILDIVIVTSNRTYTVAKLDPHNIIYSTEYLILNGAVLADMDAADTAYLAVVVTGAAQSVDVLANYSRLAGALII